MRTQAKRPEHNIYEGRGGGKEVEAKWEACRKDKDRPGEGRTFGRVQQDSVNCAEGDPRPANVRTDTNSDHADSGRVQQDSKNCA